MGWPTTDDPKTEFITLRLTASEAADLDNHVRSGNYRSRSAAVRDAVSRVIAYENKRAKAAKRKQHLEIADLNEIGHPDRETDEASGTDEEESDD